MGDAERSWNCAELKEQVLPNILIQLSKEGPPLRIRSCLCLGVSVFSLHCRLLTSPCLAGLGATFRISAGSFSGVPTNLSQLPLETMPQNDSKRLFVA